MWLYPPNICMEMIITYNAVHEEQMHFPTQVNKNLKALTVVRGKVPIRGRVSPTFQYCWGFLPEAICKNLSEMGKGDIHIGIIPALGN